METTVFKEISPDDMAFLYELMNNDEIRNETQDDITSLSHWQGYYIEHCASPNEKHFIIYDSKQKIGWVSLKGFLRQNIGGYTGTNKIWIDQLMILPNYQNKGYGRKALVFTEDIAKKYGFSQLGIFTYTSNLRARYIYKTQGYKEISKHFATIPSGKTIEIVTLEKILYD